MSYERQGSHVTEYCPHENGELKELLRNIVSMGWQAKANCHGNAIEKCRQHPDDPNAFGGPVVHTNWCRTWTSLMEQAHSLSR